ncbi:hypothetical protein [Melissococcus plutonius]|uniref:hypothetical protein n=1 Tax=Melissococcus plutonius TaxID=33970 RepID=UPI003C2E8E21
MKKITWSVLIGVAFCLLLTGCGSEKKADTSTSSAKKEIKSSTSKNNDKENEKKAEQAKKDKEAQETKEKAEKEKQAQIAQKVKEADTVMKQAETNPTDTTVNNAKSALNAIPGGNPDLQRRLDAVTVALSNAKQQAAEKAQAAQTAQANQHNAQQQQANSSGEQQPMQQARGYKGCATLTEFVNKYGMSPAAYKVQYEGYSEEEALRSTDLLTSGERQVAISKYGINN